ncbi:MFS transporter [Streptomyces sp. bgisy100]|uniref:MFS transporter n=1 Tax=Streptomyces sp. bgisy100 TaxID=3413783 RepID=UPI003D72A9A0
MAASSETPRENSARWENSAPWEASPRPGSLRATSTATLVSLLLTVLIVVGSRYLEGFDAALLPYAVATVFLAFGVVYRYTVWAQAPAARRLFRQGVRACFSRAGLRGSAAALPRMATASLGLRSFSGPRSRARWAAHQSVLWGCVLAALVAVPLSWGWISFTAVNSSGPGYELRLWGRTVVGFDSASPAGWALFHVLDLAAVLVLVGAGYFLWRRMRDRAPVTGQRFGYDLVPLLALIVISVTGLLLTFSALALHGGGYEFLAVLHMTSVVFALIHLPFGKFFHVVQRPATAGVQAFTDTARQGGDTALCRRCAAPLAPVPAVANLRGTMRELRLRFDQTAEYCPRCKRVLRGSAYLSDVKRGFR